MINIFTNIINWISNNYIIVLIIVCLFGGIYLFGYFLIISEDIVTLGWEIITQRHTRYIEQGCFINDKDYMYFSRKNHRKLKKTIKKLSKEYVVKENICFKENNKYIFFDYVIVSPYGVFPIAIHNALGILRGTPSYTKLEHITDGTTTFIINNPLIELEKNTEILANKLLVNNTPLYIHSYVGLSDSCRISMPYRENIVNFSELPNIIRSFSIERFSDSQISYIIQNLNKNNIKNLKNKKIARVTSSFTC